MYIIVLLYNSTSCLIIIVEYLLLESVYFILKYFHEKFKMYFLPASLYRFIVSVIVILLLKSLYSYDDRKQYMMVNCFLISKTVYNR